MAIQNTEERRSEIRRLLLREPEACNLLGISRTALRGLMAQGAIVPVHIGRSIRFPVSDVEALVERLRAEAAEAR